jgi:hypothetical protein
VDWIAADLSDVVIYLVRAGNRLDRCGSSLRGSGLVGDDG